MINRKYFPSKKFVASLSVAVILILIAIALSYQKPNITKYGDNNLLASNATSSINEKDSDNDGLPDWEEALYGTNPNNPDTDGDGTPDGEEIKEGRDPLKANTAKVGQEPNDKIPPEIIAENQAISTANQGLNATEKMAHNLISNIFASQPISGEMNQDTMNTLVEQSLQDIPQKQFAGTTTISDLNLTPINQNNEKEKLFAYANNYYAATKPLQKLLGQDIAVINSAISKETAIDQKSLENIMGQYQTAINIFIKMPLPAIAGSSGEIYHLAIINDLEALVAIDNDIINSGNDTVNIYADIATYNNILNDLVTSLSTIDTILGIKRQ